MDDYFVIMKTLYENLDVKSLSWEPESSGLSSTCHIALIFLILSIPFYFFLYSKAMSPLTYS